MIPGYLFDHWASTYDHATALDLRRRTEQQYAAALSKWNLQHEQATVLESGYTALVVAFPQRGLVLKCIPRSPLPPPQTFVFKNSLTAAESMEAVALRACVGRHVLEVLDSYEQGQTLLLPYLEHTTSAATYRTRFQQAKLLGDMQMWWWGRATNQVQHQLPRHSFVLDVRDTPHHRPYVPLAQATNTLQQQLQSSSTTNSMLHGDLHMGNVLLVNSEPVIIDPKPVWGDRHGDIAGIVRILVDFLPWRATSLERVIRVFSQSAHLDEQRLRQWLMVGVAAEIIWRAHHQMDILLLAVLLEQLEASPDVETGLHSSVPIIPIV